MATSPLAPSAVAATGFALETGDTTAATFGALGNDKGKGNTEPVDVGDDEGDDEGEGDEGGTCEMLRPNVQVVVTGAAGTARRAFIADTITIVRTPNVRTR
jgi:hypothetical protein